MQTCIQTCIQTINKPFIFSLEMKKQDSFHYGGDKKKATIFQTDIDELFMTTSLFRTVC